MEVARVVIKAVEEIETVLLVVGRGGPPATQYLIVTLADKSYNKMVKHTHHQGSDYHRRNRYWGSNT